MPNSFTSNEFNKQAIKNGYPARMLRKKGLAPFIRKYADNAYDGSKTWVKKEVKKEVINENTTSDEKMIQYLKSKGYKIMKPVSEWVEC